MGSEAPSSRALVYIVLLNWNGWQDTLTCLSSLEELNYPNYRVVVVDNASDNDSVVKIRECRPEIKLIISNMNLGFSGGCNIGIRHALESGADYVWLLNNDTIVVDNTLGELVAACEADSCIGATSSIVFSQINPNEIQAWGGGWVNFLIGRSGEYKEPVLSSDISYLTGASMLIKRVALKEVGLLDEARFFMYWEDVDFSLRLKKAGWKLAVAKKSTVFHKGSASVGRHSRKMISYLDHSAVQFFKKHASLPFIPVFIGLIGRFLRRVSRGEVRYAIHTLGMLAVFFKRTNTNNKIF